jgi:small subunit ribosomal protein S16
MTVKIRLKRTGMKKAPSYRIVVADSRSPRDGRIIENIGWYNPRVEPSAVNVNEERVLYWLKNGAQPTDSVSILLKRTGALDRFQAAKQLVGATKQAE